MVGYVLIGAAGLFAIADLAGKPFSPWTILGCIAVISLLVPVDLKKLWKEQKEFKAANLQKRVDALEDDLTSVQTLLNMRSAMGKRGKG